MEGSKLTHFKQASVSSIWGNSWHTRTSLESSHTEGQNAEQDIRFSGPFSKKNLIRCPFFVCFEVIQEKSASNLGV